MSDIQALQADIRGLEKRLDERLSRIEAKLDERPTTAVVYQVTFGTVFSLIAFAVAILGLAKLAGVIP